MSLDNKKAFEFVSKQYDDSIIPALKEYIAIPNLSPAYDKEIHNNGLQEQAMKVMTDWVQAQKVPGLTMEVVHEPGRTPIIFMELPATKADAGTVLMYGHMDKQPPFTGWLPDLGPYKPVIKDNNGEAWLYGRGGADDGYAIFSSLTAIQILQQQKIPHARIVIIVEGSEESGSPDLPFYIEKLASRIGSPNFIVCLDSGAGDYNRMWMTTSLRGLCVVDVKISLLREGVHSGVGSGCFADTFRVARMLLSRLEDEQTGKVLLKDLHCEIPAQRLKQTEAVAAILGDSIVSSYPRHAAVEPMEQNLSELLLNRTWRPTVTITGAGGIPEIASAGNVLRPETILRLSIRCPPRVDAKAAQQAVKKLLETNPPYNAKVTVSLGQAGAGWDAPALAPWLEDAARKASETFYGAEAAYLGEGGSIPFMGMLGAKFPKAQFLITGVLGPASNAHGPNEGMNIPFTKKLTASVAAILADHAQAKHE